MNRYYFVFLIITIIFLGYQYDKYLEDKKEISSVEINMDNYVKFYKELSSDMTKYNIDPKDKGEIELVIKKIIKEHEKEKTMKDYLHSATSGLMRGCVFGFILGNGIESAFASGGTYAVINPLFMYFGL